MSLPRDRSPLPSLPRLAAVLAAALAGACGGGAGDKAANMGGYLGGLPSWTDYAPALEEQPPEQTGPPSAATAEAADVTIYNDNGTTSVKTNVAFTCTTTPYSFTKTPDQLVSYSPSAGALWAGALVQGKTYRTGNGPLLSLPVAERGPLRIVIKTLANAENARTIDRPSQASVETARGDMIQNATLQGLSTPSTISYKMDTYHSEAEYALSVGMSGRYMGFEAAASTSTSRAASETTLAVTFIQKMYEVTVDPTSVPTPASFFGADFTKARLDEQVAQDNIGPDNPPVFVAGIVYGRMMTFTFTSSASESDIRGTIEAAYKGIGGSGAGGLGFKQKKILEQAKIRIASLGGDAKATLAMIQSGNWADYFKDSAPLTSAEPLSYTLMTLDGHPATVSEATSYQVKTCLPQSTASGGMTFPAVQAFTAPVGTPYDAVAGDFDGDGVTDLVFNHLGLTNDVSVAFGQWSGVFEAPTVPVSHPLTSLAEGWANYQLAVADLDADGKDDLVWNWLGTGANRVYVGISKGDGTFTFSSTPALDDAQNGWQGYHLFTAHLTLPAQGSTFRPVSLLWTNVPANVNRTYTGLFDPATQAITLKMYDAPITGWGAYLPGVGDIGGNGVDDLFWIRRNTPFVHTGFSDGAGGFTFGPGWSTGSDYSAYAPFVADADGDGWADVIMVDTHYPRTTSISDVVILYLWQSQGNGKFLVKPYAKIAQGYGAAWKPLVTDLTGDGAADVVLNLLTASENVVSISASTGKSDQAWNTAGAVKLTHPAGALEDWPSFGLLTGQFGGGLERDLAWVKRGATVRIALGLKT